MFFVANSADVGGLLGLFMGFSVFSIIEIIYFFIIRPCNVEVIERRRPTFRRTLAKRRARRTLPMAPQSERIHRVYPYID